MVKKSGCSGFRNSAIDFSGGEDSSRKAHRSSRIYKDRVVEDGQSMHLQVPSTKRS